MNAAVEKIDRLLYLAEIVSDDTANDDDVAELNELLLNDEALRRYYLSHCRMLFAIRSELIAHQTTQQLCGQIRNEIGSKASGVFPPVFDTPFPFVGAAIHATANFFSHEAPFGFLVATLLTGLLLLGLWLMPISKSPSPQIANLPQNASFDVQNPEMERGGKEVKPEIQYVGRITGKVDCVWKRGGGRGTRGEGIENHKSETINNKSSVALGDKLDVVRGLLEITYDTGAKVILEGPCTFHVEVNGGFLAVGRLTGKLDKKVAGGQWTVDSAKPQAASSKSLNPQIPKSPSLPTAHGPLSTAFVIATPTAQITDLGTEFGVEVDRAGQTTSHVFRGLVALRMVVADGKANSEVQLLRANQSARVERIAASADESKSSHPTPPKRCRIVLLSSQTPHADFVREIPKKTKMFDLVDVVAGGDGFSGKRNAGIDPTNGRRSNQLEFGDPHVEALFPPGDHRYHPVPELPFVDGVFIPDGSAGPVQVDSAGHMFSEFSKTDNLAAFRVWSGGTVSTVRWHIPTTLEGVDYSKNGHGLIFLHPNKGITFDLDAIRKAYPNWKIAKFLATVGNVYPKTESAADYWVLVDGEIRDRRRQINVVNHAFSITTCIRNSDRFLTLIATDGGDHIASDWIMFGDPRLEMVNVEGTQ